MNGSHFYITLPSNASLPIFPNNKTTRIKKKLPEIMDLSEDWEVGMYSISYPNTWYTLQEHENHIYYADRSGLYSAAFVEFGYYKSMEEIIEAVNASLVDSGVSTGNIDVSYETRVGKVLVRVGGGYKLALTGRMSILLGFGGKDVIIDSTTTSPHVADLEPITTIYVYCDIVTPQIVGDTSAPLLRSIPVKGKSGDLITETYTNIQYTPVQTKTFENIEILLRTDTGDPVAFERGEVVTTLHFRQHTYFT